MTHPRVKKQKSMYNSHAKEFHIILMSKNLNINAVGLERPKPS